ncbi:MAG: T9SS type B sorting domain-containing protein [Flavobacteriales bacterium]|nr:T9SS type B sorting domain-containing protein [Flavobacteriales bacterium]
MTVGNDQTVEWYVQNVLLGSGVTATNITFNGQPADQINMQCGYFQSNGSYMEVESGVVLSTGGVVGEDFTGDSVIVGEQTSIFVDNGQGGDNDLEQLSGENINDQAILEFDFIPTGDTLRFNYVFGSEEYPEYVNSFNDAFGFFLAGPGIAGTYSSPAGFPGGSINIALIPGTNTPVTIDNVNNGNANCGFGGGPSGPCTNCEFYVDNCDIEAEALDGMTTVLQAFAIVQCGETYHIKLAIGDALDSAFDSAVFLQEGSFASDLVVSAELFSSIGPYSDGFLYENCGFGTIVFSRQAGIDAESLVELEITGVAENGVDYTTIPTEFVFPEGDSLYFLDIYAFIDGLPEGLELVEITISNTSASACAQGAITSNFSFYVSDDPEPLTISTSDYAIDCGEQVDITVNVEGGYGQYDFDWSNGYDDTTQTVGPGLTTDYIITVTDTCNAGSQTDTITVTVPVYPPLSVEIADTTQLTCLQEIDLGPLNIEGGNGVYTYNWVQDGETLGTDEILTYIGSSTNVLTLNIMDGCFTQASDDMLVLVPVIPIFIDMSNDTVICKGTNAVISALASGGEPPYEYQWSHFGLTEEAIVVGPRESTVFTVYVTDLCQNVESAEVVVGVSETEALFAMEETGYFGVALENFSQGVNSDTLMYTWDFGDGEFSNEESPTHIYFDLNDQTIILNVVNEHGCTDSASISIQAPPTLYVPTSFSPNDDGINDLFKVYAEGVVDFKLIIFDRWGQEVFVTEDVNQSWNGRARQNSNYYGENDTFVYHLRARMIDGQRIDTRGVITMLR